MKRKENLLCVLSWIAFAFICAMAWHYHADDILKTITNKGVIL